MDAKEMWNLYSNKTNEDYSAWAFGSEPDNLATLVLKGEKSATASCYEFYKIDNEPLPKVGDYSVILNSKEEAVCIIKTTKIQIVPFLEVSAEHARKEGEGDKSLSYWRKVHEEVFTLEATEYNTTFSKDYSVVCEEFEVVFKL
jgi:uncharacterized protein YhfF